MRALLLTDNGPVYEQCFPTPVADSGQALIRVHCAGVCATDLQLLVGYKGGFRGVLGHEFVGDVVTAPGNESWIGRRVVGEINVGCGVCDLCRRGLGKHCRARGSLGIIGLNGAFADFLVLPVTNLHEVPQNVDDESAVFAEPLAAALQLLEQIQIRPTDRVYVLGDGRLGLLVAQVLAQTTANVVALGRNDQKLAILSACGIATRCVNQPSVLDELAAHPADIVVEVTGSHSGFGTALRLVRPGGVLALKTTTASTLPEFDLSRLVVDEITLVGSRCGPFEPALRLLAADKIAVKPLIHARYPLSACVDALRHAGQKGVLKVLIDVDKRE
ncbi:MAG: alcohol dehydrogenase catalytic domain-containing protein [Caldilineaceae bacterium]|nr:alcohol dehydrogenase catalytic domain-containing protein [Caldilineaceae bacterium]